eukprot:m.210255 g.210255  ORF g.210255 m.210255 type:complete len:451 (-) comp19003_c0_seq3:650-2002(-)
MSEQSNSVVVSLLQDVQKIRADLLHREWFDSARRPLKCVVNCGMRERIRDMNGESNTILEITSNTPNTPVLLLPVKSTSLDRIKERGYTILSQDRSPLEKSSDTHRTVRQQAPFQDLCARIQTLLTQQHILEHGQGLKDVPELLHDIPRKWEAHGDLILIPKTAFTQRKWREAVPELWKVVAEALGASKLARKADIDPGLKRQSRVKLLFGESGRVVHKDNGVLYSYDVTKCMFSSGNITEKIRVAAFPCEGQVVVDLYAGIGYFTLPYLVKANAAHVHACEWNEHAVEALRQNLILNKVSDRCTVYAGDNAVVAPAGVADRVNLGLIPSSEKGWPVACRALRQDTGGWLHVHDNVTVPVPETKVDSVELSGSRQQSSGGLESSERSKHAVFGARGNVIAAALEKLLTEREDSGQWSVDVRHIECVKPYAPRVFHVVYDVEARPSVKKNA